MSDASALDPWLLAHLACPIDKQGLAPVGQNLICSRGHTYPVVHGIPVLLVENASPTHPAIPQTFEEVSGTRPMQNHSMELDGDIDPVVQTIVSATCGYLYQHLPGRLTRYPIPDLRLPQTAGARFLDVGCNWGRWSIAAHRNGYSPVGLDPDLGPIFAARRVCSSLSVDATFVVGDARFLPFSNGAFDVVFSYSVLQHFSKSDARQALSEVARLLSPGGTSLIQMPNAFGVRSLYHILRRGFSAPKDFDVRYWTPREMQDTFSRLIGPSELSVDGFGGLGIQPADRDMFPSAYRFIVDVSELLRGLARKVPLLGKIADSIYVQSRRQGALG